MPETHRVVADECSPSFTYCDLLVRYDRSQLEAPLSTPNRFSRLLMRTSWFMTSKYAEMSRPTNMVASLSSAAVYTLLMTCSSAVSVKCLHRYAKCRYAKASVCSVPATPRSWKLLCALISAGSWISAPYSGWVSSAEAAPALP